MRPRGWHLVEKHLQVDGSPISASLFDFGLYVFRNAKELLARGSGPYFYLPKLESHLEARLWNDVFNHAQDALGIPRGTIRATVLIETILAAFEMEEILYELRDHMAGLNAGRWDYIFSVIRSFRNRDFVLPDRVQVTMTVPFMRAYTELLVRTCHARGAHAIGGMAAFIPSRRDAEVNRIALEKVREDKEREAGDGFDGTWVAHPDLVPVATEVFDRKLGSKKNQKDRLREDVAVRASQLHDFAVPGGTITEAGVRNNVSVAIQYLSAWLQGSGAVAIFNLMEDAATAEISRSQLWQWVRHGAALAGDGKVSADLYRRIRDEELQKLGGPGVERYGDAAAILDGLVLADTIEEFLTLRPTRCWVEKLVTGYFFTVSQFVTCHLFRLGLRDCVPQTRFGAIEILGAGEATDLLVAAVDDCRRQRLHRQPLHLGCVPGVLDRQPEVLELDRRAGERLDHREAARQVVLADAAPGSEHELDVIVAADGAELGHDRGIGCVGGGVGLVLRRVLVELRQGVRADQRRLRSQHGGDRAVRELDVGLVHLEGAEVRERVSPLQDQAGFGLFEPRHGYGLHAPAAHVEDHRRRQAIRDHQHRAVRRRLIDARRGIERATHVEIEVAAGSKQRRLCEGRAGGEQRGRRQRRDQTCGARSDEAGRRSRAFPHVAGAFYRAPQGLHFEAGRRRMSHLFAYFSRMKFIRRWGLMRSTYPENVQEHSQRVALVAHALALIRNRLYGGAVDPERVAVLALFHDSGEVLTGDLPSPIKYRNPEIRTAYHEIEASAADTLLGMVPEPLRDDYRSLLLGRRRRSGRARDRQGGGQAVRLDEVPRRDGGRQSRVRQGRGGSARGGAVDRSARGALVRRHVRPQLQADARRAGMSVVITTPYPSFLLAPRTARPPYWRRG